MRAEHRRGIVINITVYVRVACVCMGTYIARLNRSEMPVDEKPGHYKY